MVCNQHARSNLGILATASRFQRFRYLTIHEAVQIMISFSTIVECELAGKRLASYHVYLRAFLTITLSRFHAWHRKNVTPWGMSDMRKVVKMHVNSEVGSFPARVWRIVDACHRPRCAKAILSTLPGNFDLSENRGRMAKVTGFRVIGLPELFAW